MRWDLIDRFVVLKKGERAFAEKKFTGGEDFFTEHHPGQPSVPEPLFLEMIAQTGGVLYGLGIGFKKEVILAKIEEARFPVSVRPPCRFQVEASLEEEREEGAWIFGSVRQEGSLVASAKILLVAIDTLGEASPGKVVFNDRFLAHYDIWNVAKQSEGATV